MAAMRFSKSTPDSMAPRTSSLAPKTPSNSWNFSDNNSKYTLVGGVLAVEKVDHHHIMLLAIAMAAANALFDALRVPGQIVVDDQRAELKVDALGAGFGGNHDPALARGSNPPVPNACRPYGNR